MIVRFTLGLLACLSLLPASASAASPLGQFEEFAFSNNATQPSGIASGPGNKIWFTGFAAQTVGNLDPATATPALPGFTEFPLSPNPGNPGRIITGPDGNLWYTKVSTHRIGRITPGGVVTEYDVSGKGMNGPFGMAVGPDNKLWVIGYLNSTVANFSPADLNATFAVSSLKANGGDPDIYPTSVASGPDGNLWVTVYGLNGIEDEVLKVNTSRTVLDRIALLTAGAGPWDIISSGGSLWVTERKANKIARVSTSGTVAEFPVPTPASAPAGLAADSSGSIWFTEHDSGKIGRLVDFEVTDEFTVPSPSSYPEFISLGPDGNMWFTESSNSAGKIGRVGTVPLTINVTKTGSGTVSSSPSGLNCGDTCGSVFDYNSTVTLTAAPAEGYVFSGWSGDCSGTAGCTLTMSKSYTVAATFTPSSNPDPGPSPKPDVDPKVSVTGLKAKLNKRLAYLYSKVTVDTGGVISQQAKTGNKAWCSVIRSSSAGLTKTLKCKLGYKARRILRKRNLKLSVTTTLTVKDKAPVSVVSPVVIKKRR